MDTNSDRVEEVKMEYDAPRVVEDVELESRSMGCDKADAGCSAGGSLIS